MDQAHHVPGRMVAILQNTCDMTIAVDQSAVCKSGANAIVDCRFLDINCGNKAITNFNCALQTKIAAAQQAAGAEPSDVRDEMQADAKRKGYASVNDYLQTTISAACGSTDTAVQTLVTTVSCEDASNVIVNALNTMDASTACVSVILASMVQDARLQTANKAAGAKPPLMSNALFVAVCLGGALLLGVGIGLAIVFQRATPKGPAAVVPIMIVNPTTTGTP